MKYFQKSEFDCTHCGVNHMETSFLHRLDELRELCGFPFVITSGYRCKNHPEEYKKPSPGHHNQGHAADIKVNNGDQRRRLVDAALEMDFQGIGVARDFVHVDDRSSTPVLWTY